MLKIINILEKGIRVINSALRNVCMSLLFFMMILGTCDVLGRYLFRKPIIGTLEIFEIILPSIVLLGLGYTQERNNHVRVEILISRLSFQKRTILNFVSNALALFISLLILWRGLIFAVTYWRMGRKIPTIEVPMFICQLLVPIGAFLLIIVLVVQMIQFFVQLTLRR